MSDAQEAANDRIDNLEMRVAHQDEVIEALNKTVIDQWGKLDQALAWIERLEDRLREINMGAVRDAADEPPPPHY
jgi:SlyX protein